MNAHKPAGRRRAKGRAAWGSISREQVIDAAERVVREGRSDQMTIRSLAAELGVAPMSLYRHVRDKDDLFDEVADRLLAGAWRPRTRRDDWRLWTSEAADRLRTLLVREPVALHAFLQHPVVTPTAITRMDAMLDVLSSAGFTTAQTRQAYGAIHTYTVGFAALEASRGEMAGRDDDRADGVAKELAKLATPAQFKAGLQLLLDGICADAGFPPAGVRFEASLARR
ncbi:MAG TPA: TetR/AcrR family transcriptional regulator [Acidimicrobiales bacterium]|nr:TetR/AcrR family transcriptional regulator [Acidimicrobiales bacterium]